MSELYAIQQRKPSEDPQHVESTAADETNVNQVSASASIYTPSSRGGATRHVKDNTLRDEGTPTTTSTVQLPVAVGLGMEGKVREKRSESPGMIDEGMIEQFQNSTIADPHWDDALTQLKEGSNEDHASLSDRVVETHHNPHNKGNCVVDRSSKSASSTDTIPLPPGLTRSRNEVVSKQDQLVGEIETRGMKKLALRFSRIGERVTSLQNEAMEKAAGQLNEIKVQSSLVRQGRATDKQLPDISTFLFLQEPKRKGRTSNLQLGTLHTWPQPVTYKTLPAFLYQGRVNVPNVLYVHKCPTPYFLEAVTSVDAHTGDLFLTSGGHSRRSVGQLDVQHRNGCLSSEQTQVFFTTTERTVTIYNLKHHQNINLCEVVFYRELVIEGAVGVYGISCFHSTGLLAVGDMKRNRITLIHPDGNHLHHISLDEAGVQMNGGLGGLTWGLTERDMYLCDAVGLHNDPERCSVFHLELYPTRVRWRAAVVDPYTIWYRRGLLCVISMQEDPDPSHMLLVSAHDGQLIKPIPSYPGVDHVGLGEEDNQKENTVILQYNYHSPSDSFSEQESAAVGKKNLTGEFSKVSGSKQNPEPADHSDLLDSASYSIPHGEKNLTGEFFKEGRSMQNPKPAGHSDLLDSASSSIPHGEVTTHYNITESEYQNSGRNAEPVELADYLESASSSIPHREVTTHYNITQREYNDLGKNHERTDHSDLLGSASFSIPHREATTHYNITESEYENTGQDPKPAAYTPVLGTSASSYSSPGTQGEEEEEEGLSNNMSDEEFERGLAAISAMIAELDR